MALAQDKVHSALSLIETAGLPHPQGSLLKSFVQDAVNPEVAALYVHEGLITRGGAETLVSDWTYIVDSSKIHFSPCCLCHVANCLTID
jgi:hypothetical protein